MFWICFFRHRNLFDIRKGDQPEIDFICNISFDSVLSYKCFWLKSPCQSPCQNVPIKSCMFWLQANIQWYVVHYSSIVHYSSFEIAKLVPTAATITSFSLANVSNSKSKRIFTWCTHTYVSCNFNLRREHWIWIETWDQIDSCSFNLRSEHTIGYLFRKTKLENAHTFHQEKTQKLQKWSQEYIRSRIKHAVLTVATINSFRFVNVPNSKPKRVFTWCAE